MIGIFDVGYDGEVARVGCVSVDSLLDDSSSNEWVVSGIRVEKYVPGEFWKRELPPLLAGIRSAPARLSVCLIDAYVDLGEERTPGLGRILHDRTGLPVIGVAKSPFPGTPVECEVRRGSSRRPVFVTTAGYDLTDAKQQVVQMAGQGRIPTLLRRTDHLSRSLVCRHL